MSKPIKSKKEKVPKLTEAEYTAYIASLKEGTEKTCKVSVSAMNGGDGSQNEEKNK